ncbi:MAG TPA: BON domain-containing protein [Candidatus Limnocylindria bacterium]|nr:BON domain-containing protein [Candidatus Limnocylindria bacterium]
MIRRRSMFSIAVLSVALAAGCAKKPDDGVIVTNIKSQMFSSPLLKNSDLKVSSSRGEVTLNGTVGSDAARLEAYEFATKTPGVVKVDDQMTVEVAPGSASAAQPSAMPASMSAPAAVPSHKPRQKKKDEPETEPAQSPPPPQPAPVPVSTPAPPAQPTVAPPTPVPTPPPQPKQVVIPANSTLIVRMIDGVDSKVNRAGEIFHASVDAPLMVDDQVVVPQGADIYVRLSAASSAGHYTGKSELHMELVQLEFQGRSYPLVSSTYSAAGKSRGKNTAEKVGGGAAVGAVIGAIAGGGKGAAIGAGVGAGSGAVWNGVTRGQQIKIPAETMLEFQLEQPVAITVRARTIPAAQ